MIDPPPPAELAFLTEAIGAEATLALIEARAGTRVYVPTRNDADSVLAQMIGAPAAAALAVAHGGCYIPVPAAKRWRALVFLRRQMPVTAVARHLGLSERTVYLYQTGARGQRQLDGQTPQRRRDLKPLTQTELPI